MFITAELDGKRIAYHASTEFLVQVGKKGRAYVTKYRTTGNLKAAVLMYCGYNIGNGYQKRLIAPSMNKPVLAKQVSI